MKVRHRLLNFKNKIIYQDDHWFNFSLDSVLLSNFVTIRKNDKNVIDFCTGNAIIPFLLTYRTSASITGIEIQKFVYELGVESAVENGFDNQIKLINDDIKNLVNLFSAGSFDVVTCNPPYFKYTSDKYLNDDYVKCVARHEILVNLEDVVLNASYLLKNGGTFAMVHQCDRLTEIINLLQKYNIEPKKLQFVYPKLGVNSNMLLIEGVKRGKVGLKVLKPFYVHNDDGSYTKEVKKMFQE